MARVKLLKPFGAPQAPQFFFSFLLLPKAVKAGTPVFFFSSTVAEGGVEGAALPEDEGNPAEGGCFASFY